MNGKPYTEEALSMLRRYYRDISSLQVLAVLTGHSVRSLQGKAAMLKIKRNRKLLGRITRMTPEQIDREVQRIRSEK